MKKFLGILVSITLCLCMLAPAAFAADTSSLSGLLEGLEGVDLGTLTDGELSQLLGGLNLEGFDVDSLKSAIESGDSNKLAGLEDALKTLGTSDTASGSDSASSSGSDSALGGLSDMLGGIDISWITDAFSNPDALSSITDMFSGATDGSSGFDLSALMDTISGAFSGGGIDLSSITSGIDLGSFDIGSLLGGLGGGSSEGGDDSSGGDAASGATDAISGIMDKLMSGLSGLGLDTSLIEGLLDNEIVDFFANLYIGLGQVGGDEGGSEEEATTKPAVVTTKPPETGDTSAVVVAVATLAVASAAAFVCLKKKKDD
ncbi:MAG: hypothetical protein ACI4SB_02010 [Acutalibacteraceae bacterium]